MVITKVDHKSQRVTLTRLPVVEKHRASRITTLDQPTEQFATSDNLEDEEHGSVRGEEGSSQSRGAHLNYGSNRIILPATIAAVLSDGRRCGLVLLIDAETELQQNVFVDAQWADQNTLRTYQDRRPGESVLVALTYRGGSRRIEPGILTQADRQTLQNQLPDIVISTSDDKLVLELRRRMITAEYDQLRQYIRGIATATAIFELYRATNRPDVELIDAELVKRIDERYPVGTLIEDCPIVEVKDDWIIVEVEPKVQGSIQRRVWTSGNTANLGNVAQLGQCIDVLVMRREYNGFLRLSRAHAAVTSYLVNARYIGTVTEIQHDHYIVALRQNDNGHQVEHQLVGGLLKREFIRRLDGGTITCVNELVRGQLVDVRIEAIDVTREQVRIFLTHWKAYETSFEVGAYTKRGNLARTRQSVEGEYSKIILPQQDQAGKIIVYSRDKAHHRQAVQQVRQLVSGLRLENGTEPRTYLPDHAKPRQRVTAGGIDRMHNASRLPAEIAPGTTAPAIPWLVVGSVIIFILIVLIVLLANR